MDVSETAEQLVTLRSRAAALEELIEVQEQSMLDQGGRLGQALTELKGRDELKRAILSSLAAHIAVIDSAGKIVEVNEAWKCFATDNGDPPLVSTGVGANYLEVVDRAAGRGSSTADEALDGLRRVLDGSTASFAMEYACHSSTQNRWFEMRVTPLPAGNGCVVAHENITKRREADDNRQAMEVELRQARKLESIGRLAAGIAHEINTPVQFVSDNVVFLQRAFDGLLSATSYARSLIEEENREGDASEIARLIADAFKTAKVDYFSTQAPRALEQTLEGLGRIVGIVGAMNELSHPGQHEKQPVDLAQAITTTLTVARNEWKFVADVETDFDPSLPPVPGLRDELNQVFLNLIVNASNAVAEANPDGTKGKIVIRTQLVENCVGILVSDTGVGIPPEIRDKIFDPFFTTKEVGKGTGKGLAIVRSVVVDKHNGRIDVSSEPGVGTTFIITLPLSDSVDATSTA